MPLPERAASAAAVAFVGFQLNDIQWAEPAALEALVDALLARTCRVEKLALHHGFNLSPAYLPAVARLVAGHDGAALKSVNVGLGEWLFRDASAADVEVVCAALRRTTLTHVRLHGVGLTLTEQSQSTNLLREAAVASPRLSFEC